MFFFKPPIRSRSPLLTGSRLISLPLATKMFQFAKFEKSKERRLATELGYGFPIGDPWITDGISPWPFASESVLPSQCPGIHPMHSFTPRGAYTSRLSKFCSKTSSENLYREGFPAAQQFFHTNLAARRCYWHNNRYTIG